MHYRTKCCEGDPKIKLSKAEEPNPGRLVENYLNEIFDERKISDEQRAELWKFYFDHLDKGIAEGYNPKVEFRDEDLVNSLRQNIAEFCAFKENSFRNSATDLLIDENGNLRGKSEFLAEAAKINDVYNRRWLGTEYDQTVANANSAQQWQDFQRAKDLYPNLRYMTVGDDRVRAEHEALDGIVKPLDDPFWDAWMPPNDWGCRCWVEQTDDEEKGDVPGGVQMKIEFENNPWKTGEIFPKSAYEKGLSKSDVKDAISFAADMLSEKGIATEVTKEAVAEFAAELRANLPQVFEHEEFGKVLINKKSVNKTVSINAGRPEYQKNSLQIISDIEKHVKNAVKPEKEEIKSSEKAARKKNIGGYHTVTVSNGKKVFEVAFQENKSLENADRSLYYVKQKSE